MRDISSMPVPDSRLLGGSLPRINSRHPDVRNSLVEGKMQEFRRIGLFLRKSVPKTSANSVVSEEIPYATGQGINSREQGIDSAFSTGAGNLA
jgi:hypothetical protein